MSRHQLQISKCVYGGDGLAVLNGKAVFIEGALPGETVEVEVVEDKKSYLRAQLMRVVVPSPYRVTPACSYSSSGINLNPARVCGGCQYQHVSYEEELRIKEAQVREILERAGFKAVLEPIAASKKEHGYRSSLTLHPVNPKSKSTTRLGLIAKDNQSVIAVNQCLIADPLFLPLFSKELPARRCPDRMTFKLDEAGRIIDDMKESYLRMSLGEEGYLVHSGGFFQTNPEIANQILEAVRSEIERVRPDLLLDLFSGVGTFGLACRSFCASTVFIEESDAAVKALRMNIEERKLESMRVLHGKAEALFSQALLNHESARLAILLDPPRAGLQAGLAQRLAHVRAEKMIYVSCDPVTLARDLQIILGGGLYTLQHVKPFDMFPRTKHVEVLAILSSLTSTQTGRVL